MASEFELFDLLVIAKNTWEEHRRAGYTPRGYLHHSFFKKGHAAALKVLLERGLMVETSNERRKGYVITWEGREQVNAWISQQTNR